MFKAFGLKIPCLDMISIWWDGGLWTRNIKESSIVRFIPCGLKANVSYDSYSNKRVVNNSVEVLWFWVGTILSLSTISIVDWDTYTVVLGVLLDEDKVFLDELFDESVGMEVYIGKGVGLFLIIDKGVRLCWELITIGESDTGVMIGSALCMLPFVWSNECVTKLVGYE